MKRIVYEILDECDYVIVSEGKGSDKADKLIDEAVEFYNSTNEQINSAKTKAEFNNINAEVTKKSEDFVEKLNKLN